MLTAAQRTSHRLESFHIRGPTTGKAVDRTDSLTGWTKPDDCCRQNEEIDKQASRRRDWENQIN